MNSSPYLWDEEVVNLMHGEFFIEQYRTKKFSNLALANTISLS